VRDDVLTVAAAALVIGAACTPLHRGADLGRGDASSTGPAVARGDGGDQAGAREAGSLAGLAGPLGDRDAGAAPPLVRVSDAAPLTGELDPPSPVPLDAWASDTYLPPSASTSPTDAPLTPDPPPAPVPDAAPAPAPQPTPSPPPPTPSPPPSPPPQPPPQPEPDAAPPPPAPPPSPPPQPPPPPPPDAAPPPPPPSDAGPSNCGAAAPPRTRYRFEIDQAGGLPLGSASDPAGDWYGGDCSAAHRGAGCQVKASRSGGVGPIGAGCEVTDDPGDCRCRVRWWADATTRIRCEITISERRACPPR
jgi:hypothetical protein